MAVAPGSSQHRRAYPPFPGPSWPTPWRHEALGYITRAAMNARTFLEELFRAAVAAAHPATCLAPHLPAPPRSGRLILLAAGKAAGSMTEVAERHYLDGLQGPQSHLTGLPAPPPRDARP